MIDLEDCHHHNTRYQVFLGRKEPWVGLMCNDCGTLIEEVRTVNLTEVETPATIRSIFPLPQSSYVH